MSDMIATMLILKLNNMVDEAVRDFESERQAHAETKARLEALEDAVRILIDTPMAMVLPEVIEQALINSRSRQKDKI